jgi:HTH domain
LAWRSSGEWSGERAEPEAGFFSIRDSVDHVAGRLDLTRYTIYNYLGNIRADRRDAACALTAIPSHQFGVVVEQPQ